MVRDSSSRKRNVHESPTLRGLPMGIWALGLVSLLMDASSELIHSLLPVFMTTVLGTSMVTIGLVEGIAEATAAIMKVFSGAISDYRGKRKWLAVIGYGCAALTKPLFPLATNITWVFIARFVDRIGKGIRGAPRDALIADIAPPALRGAAYGLRQSLDSVGAFAGPVLAMAGMVWLAGDIRAVLWIAVVPALLSVAVLVAGVREPASHSDGHPPRKPITWRDVTNLSPRFWLVVALGAVFTLARFSEAFLVLRGQELGLALRYVPAVLIVMNVAYAASAYPAGSAADRVRQGTLLAAGLVALAAADAVLALASNPQAVFVGAAFWGLHMGLTQGIFAKLVADSAAPAIRATAFGIFNLIGGFAILLASVVAGVLWSLYGAAATFAASGGLAILALTAWSYDRLRRG